MRLPLPALALVRDYDHAAMQHLVEAFKAVAKTANVKRSTLLSAGVCFLVETMQPGERRGLMDLLRWASYQAVSYGPRPESRPGSST